MERRPTEQQRDEGAEVPQLVLSHERPPVHPFWVISQQQNKSSSAKCRYLLN